MKTPRLHQTSALIVAAISLTVTQAVAQSSGLDDATTTVDPTVGAATAAQQQANARQPSVTCAEHVPNGKERPSVEEQFPERGVSGHAVPLVLKITHGKGERVLDDSFEFQAGSDGAAALRRAGFEFPTKGSPATPKVERTEGPSNATTVVTLNVIPLPVKSGQQLLTLPPLPIAVARPSGEVMTLCSGSHVVTVDDPTANVPNAMPKRHPGPERQQELWAMLRNLVYGGLIGIALALAFSLVFRWYRRRPKALPPPPPPRPAWEIALEELHDIRHSDLIRQGRLTAHLERVNYTLRAYLGRTYNFDGLESTTEEVLRALKATTLPQPLFARTEAMLHDSDLVKFAKIQPTEAQCQGAFDDVEQLVKRTMHEERSASSLAEPNVAAPFAGAAVLRPRDAETVAPTTRSSEVRAALPEGSPQDGDKEGE